MEYLLLFTLLLLIVLLLLLVYKAVRWILKSSIRKKWASNVILMAFLLLGIKKILLNKMTFVQSNIYENLYLIKYPTKDQDLLEKVIIKKIKEYLLQKHAIDRLLIYNDKNVIYFYEYGGAHLGFMGDAGTSYFINHKEDIGGFVTEELAMYQNQRIVEFSYQPCSNDSNFVSGEINYFYNGDLLDTYCLEDLQIAK